MDDQPQGVDADPLERMIGYLGEEENATPAEAENEAEETEANVEEESQEETETAPETEEAVEVIIHNGEEKQLTKTELKELAQQGFDYTQKTQQLAEQRRYVEQQAQLVQQQAQFAAQFTDQIAEVKAVERQLAEWKQVNWTELAQTDPMQYLSLHHQYTEAKENYQTKIQGLNQLQTQAQQVQAQQSAQRLQMEAQAMKQAIPEWKNEAVASAEMGELKQWLIKSGLDERDIGSITDHRQVAIARKAMLYDKMMASGKQKVAAVPPTAKPGSVAKPTRTIDQKARETLRRTGNADIAAKLIERLL